MKTIQTKTHLLLVDETIKGRSGYNYNYGLFKIDKLEYSYEKHSTEWNCCVKIIAASPKLGDLPEFETLPPNTGDDVEKLADDYFNKNYPVEITRASDKKAILEDYIAGYRQAKSETGFSLEDMVIAMREYGNWCLSMNEKTKSFEQARFDIIQSLTKPKE